MSRIAAVGRATELAGYALAGVEVVDARDPESVRRAWGEIPADVALVLLTAEARRSLPERIDAGDRLWAVLPE